MIALSDLAAAFQTTPVETTLTGLFAAIAALFGVAIVWGLYHDWTHTTPQPRFHNRRLELYAQREQLRAEALQAQREQERRP